MRFGVAAVSHSSASGGRVFPLRQVCSLAGTSIPSESHSRDRDRVVRGCSPRFFLLFSHSSPHHNTPVDEDKAATSHVEKTRFPSRSPPAHHRTLQYFSPLLPFSLFFWFFFGRRARKLLQGEWKQASRSCTRNRAEKSFVRRLDSELDTRVHNTGSLFESLFFRGRFLTTIPPVLKRQGFPGHFSLFHRHTLTWSQETFLFSFFGRGFLRRWKP